MNTKFIFSLIILFYYHSTFAQRDYSPWTQQQCTSAPSLWHKCIVTVPKYMGPNALPVPNVKNGLIDDNYIFLLGFDYHSANQEKTFNLRTEAYFPVIKNKVALTFHYVPIEFFEVDSLKSIERGIVNFNYQNQGNANGDLYIGTNIQIFHLKKPQIHLSASINIKTASGTNLGNARHTDTPGYFLDVALGKIWSIEKSNFLGNIHLYTTLGFYVWQTHSDIYFQNDAFLYGIGLDLNFKNFRIQNTLRGYRGYLTGDKPLIMRFLIAKQIKNLEYAISYQQGNADYPFKTFSFNTKYIF